MAGTAAILIGALVVSALLAVEIWAWWDAHGDPALAGPSLRRLLRRGLGAVALLVTLGLLLMPPPEPVGLRLARLLACLGLCGVVVVIAIYDYRLVRRELRREVEGFVNDSAHAFRQQLQDMARKNPELAEKMPELLSEEPGERAEPSRD